MAIEIRAYAAADLEMVRAIGSDPSLVWEFERFESPGGTEIWLADHHFRTELLQLGFVDGKPAGFAGGFVLPGRQAPWAMLRVGVLEPFRRRGVGAALLRAADARLRVIAPDCGEVCVSAWIPNPAAEAFAIAYGFRHSLYYWRMERPRGGPPPVVEWPAGITLRSFDHADTFFEDWTRAYNAAFAEERLGVVATVQHARALAAKPHFLPDGIVLAYRGEQCVGFCRDELHAGRGEVSVLGVTPDARGIGLGRALLRWGVNWLETQNAPRVTLFVDGKNETALRLYRSEGFETVRTREVWTRPMTPS